MKAYSLLLILLPILAIQASPLTFPINYNPHFLPTPSDTPTDEDYITNPITNHNAQQYFTTINLGSTKEAHNLAISTTDTMVKLVAPGCNCTLGCSNVQTYNYHNSQDSEFIGGCLSLSKNMFGSGNWVNDSFTIANLEAKNVQICDYNVLSNDT
mmetsp:Transcript_21992/g.18859  ORF Transcript_21992/g.18859 Transcript_21992/m.18859 type:complete len:155 (-) Transcript_21992:644-1108(-)